DLVPVDHDRPRRDAVEPDGVRAGRLAYELRRLSRPSSEGSPHGGAPPMPRAASIELRPFPLRERERELRRMAILPSNQRARPGPAPAGADAAWVQRMSRLIAQNPRRFADTSTDG